MYDTSMLTKPDGFIGYMVLLKKDEISLNNVSVTSNLAEVELGGLSPFTNYTFKVAANSETLMGNYSAVIGFRTESGGMRRKICLL